MTLNPNDLNRIADTVDSVNQCLPVIKSNSESYADLIRQHEDKAKRANGFMESFLEAVSRGQIATNEVDEDELMVMVKEVGAAYDDYADHVDSLNNKITQVSNQAADLQVLLGRVGDKLRRIRDTF